MKLKLKAGTTSKLVRVFAQDSAATDGSGKAGIAHNASGLTAYYLPEGDATPTQITLAAGTTGTYASGAWSEVDGTNMPGVYELGLPDAVVDATSEGSVVVMLKGATDMAPILLEIELDAVDYQDGSAFGLSRLDAAITSRNSVAPDNTSITAVKAVTDSLPDSGALTSLATASALTTVDTVVDAIKAVTDALPNSGALSDLATAANLATVDAVVDAIKVVTDSLPNGGSLSDLATAVSIAALNDFDPATQTVTTDAASRTASQADVSALATAAALTTTDAVVDSNKVILDKVDSALEADGPVHRLTTNALEQAPSGGSGDAIGSGSTSHEVTVNVAGSPEAGVDVWVSTDSAGTNVVAGTLVTDAFGKATFMLDPGTYYLWAQKAGSNFTNPTSFTVS